MANTEAKVRGFDSSQLRIFLTYNGSKREVGIISTDLNGSSAASGETFRTNSSPLETASTTRLIIRRISRVSCPNSFLRPTSGFLFHLNFNRKGLFYLFDIFRCHGGDRIGSLSDQRPKKKSVTNSGWKKRSALPAFLGSSTVFGESKTTIFSVGFSLAFTIVVDLQCQWLPL